MAVWRCAGGIGSFLTSRKPALTLAPGGRSAGRRRTTPLIRPDCESGVLTCGTSVHTGILYEYEYE